MLFEKAVCKIEDLLARYTLSLTLILTPTLSNVPLELNRVKPSHRPVLKLKYKQAAIGQEYRNL